MPDESVGVFVEPALPRGVRVCKVDISRQGFGHGLMFGEFPTVIVSNCEDSVFMSKECPFDALSDELGLFVFGRREHGEFGFAFDEGGDHTAMVLADERIAFPVTDT